jgi:hypothetical protein
VAETYVSQGALHRRLCLAVCRTPGIFFDVFRLRRQRLGWRGGAAASDVARVDDGGCLAVLEHEAYDSQAAWHGCDAVEQFAMVRTQNSLRGESCVRFAGGGQTEPWAPQYIAIECPHIPKFGSIYRLNCEGFTSWRTEFDSSW